MDLSSIILIEGPDGAGKTTLARSLATRTYLHQGPFGPDPLNEAMTLLLAHKGQRLVLDRFHLGEQVYGPIFRGKDALGPAGRRMLERYLLSRRTLVVFCLPPRDVCWDVWVKRAQTGKEMFTDSFDTVYQGFARIAAMAGGTQLPFVCYDRTKEDEHTFIVRMLAALKQLPANKGPGVGSFRPAVTLLVGEQCSRPDLNPNAQPFIGRGGCSGWLAEQLDAANIDEKGLYWINALDLRGEWTHGDFLLDLKPKRIITLGMTASRWLERERLYVAAGTDIKNVPHPQHHKRFHYTAPYALIEALKGE